MKKVLGVLLVTLLLTSCLFGHRKYERATSYNHGKVYLSGKGKGYYHVGILPEIWLRMKVKAHAIAFHNADVGATIATDAFCGPSYDDLSLKVLTSNLLSEVEGLEIISQNDFILDGRGALRTLAGGSVDGIPMDFDVVAINKNQCNVDFMCIAPKGMLSQVVSDFEGFFVGFHYE